MKISIIIFIILSSEIILSWERLHLGNSNLVDNIVNSFVEYQGELILTNFTGHYYYKNNQIEFHKSLILDKYPIVLNKTTIHNDVLWGVCTHGITKYNGKEWTYLDAKEIPEIGFNHFYTICSFDNELWLSNPYGTYISNQEGWRKNDTVFAGLFVLNDTLYSYDFQGLLSKYTNQESFKNYIRFGEKIRSHKIFKDEVVLWRNHKAYFMDKENLDSIEMVFNNINEKITSIAKTKDSYFLTSNYNLYEIDLNLHEQRLINKPDKFAELTWGFGDIIYYDEKIFLGSAKNGMFIMNLNNLSVENSRIPNLQLVKSYPNPSKGQLWIEYYTFPNQPYEFKVELIDFIGRKFIVDYKVENVNGYYGKLMVDISRVIAGQYILNIIDSKGSNKSKLVYKD